MQTQLVNGLKFKPLQSLSQKVEWQHNKHIKVYWCNRSSQMGRSENRERQNAVRIGKKKKGEWKAQYLLKWGYSVKKTCSDCSFLTNQHRPEKSDWYPASYRECIHVYSFSLVYKHVCYDGSHCFPVAVLHVKKTNQKLSFIVQFNSSYYSTVTSS